MTSSVPMPMYMAPTLPAAAGPQSVQPSGASSALLPSKANSSRSTMRNVSLVGPSVGRQRGSRTIECVLPSIARWNVSATMRAPTPRAGRR